MNLRCCVGIAIACSSPPANAERLAVVIQETVEDQPNATPQIYNELVGRLSKKFTIKDPVATDGQAHALLGADLLLVGTVRWIRGKSLEDQIVYDISVSFRLTAADSAQILGTGNFSTVGVGDSAKNAFAIGSRRVAEKLAEKILDRKEPYHRYELQVVLAIPIDGVEAEKISRCIDDRGLVIDGSLRNDQVYNLEILSALAPDGLSRVLAHCDLFVKESSARSLRAEYHLAGLKHLKVFSMPFAVRRHDKHLRRLADEASQKILVSLSNNHSFVEIVPSGAGNRNKRNRLRLSGGLSQSGPNITMWAELTAMFKNKILWRGQKSCDVERADDCLRTLSESLSAEFLLVLSRGRDHIPLKIDDELPSSSKWDIEITGTDIPVLDAQRWAELDSEPLGYVNVRNSSNQKLWVNIQVEPSVFGAGMVPHRMVIEPGQTVPVALWIRKSGETLPGSTASLTYVIYVTNSTREYQIRRSLSVPVDEK